MLTICKGASLSSSEQLGLHRFRGCGINYVVFKYEEDRTDFYVLQDHNHQAEH